MTVAGCRILLRIITQGDLAAFADTNLDDGFWGLLPAQLGKKIFLATHDSPGVHCEFDCSGLLVHSRSLFRNCLSA